MRVHEISSPIELTEYNYNVCGSFTRGCFEADGTRYTAFAMRVRDFKLGSLGYVEDGWLVVCGLNRTAYLFQKRGFLHWSYLMEKFRLNQCDAENMAYLIGNIIGRECEYEFEYKDDG